MPDGESPRKTHSGVRKRGNWEEISGFASEVQKAMEESDIREDSVRKYDEWRPRKDDSVRQIRRKTVDSASISTREVEKNSEGIAGDVEKATGEMKKAGGKVKKGEPPEDELKDASREMVRPFFSYTLKLFRDLEKRLYTTMIWFNSFYFDAEDVAVDVKKQGEDDYEMDVKVPEDNKRKQIQDRMS